VTTLVGSRVSLRPLTADDVPALVAYRNDPLVVRFQSWSTYSEEAARELVAAMAESLPGVDGEWHQWAISSNGLLVGDIGLRTFDDARQGEIGVTLAPSARGRGLATEAVRLVLGCAFGPLGFHRVVAGSDPANAAVAALLTRVGFRREGLERASVFVHGEWADDERWALLAEDWLRPGADELA
jgi:RimJ/RimL family protein N-acetyltransferase